jgi:hypothetical protein
VNRIEDIPTAILAAPLRLVPVAGRQLARHVLPRDVPRRPVAGGDPTSVQGLASMLFGFSHRPCQRAVRAPLGDHAGYIAATYSTSMVDCTTEDYL